MLLEACREFINSFPLAYMDTLTKLRYVSVVRPDKSTSMEWGEVPELTDIPCKVSLSTPDNPLDTEVDGIPVKAVLKVFCDRSVNIAVGDHLILRKRAESREIIAEYTGICGLPLVMPMYLKTLVSVIK